MLTQRDEMVRIAGIGFLNARPLTAGLEARLAAPFPYVFSTAEPAACADRLLRGAAEAALVPAAALPGLGQVTVVPELGIASRGEVTSVLLVSRVPFAAIRVLAAHSASRTSVALARLLLAERFGCRPEIVPAAPPLDLMLANADAAVLIGDPALAVRGRSGLAELDLGGAWTEWTGLPFVFAVWALAPAAPPAAADLLARSLAFARERWEDLLPRWAAGADVGLECARRYLGETLVYRLGEAEAEGMREFLSRAAAAGVLLPPPAPVATR